LGCRGKVGDVREGRFPSQKSFFCAPSGRISDVFGIFSLLSAVFFLAICAFFAPFYLDLLFVFLAKKYMLGYRRGVPLQNQNHSSVVIYVT